jgi:hypothetical protein
MTRPRMVAMVAAMLLAGHVAAQTEPPRVLIKDVKGCQLVNPFGTANTRGRYEWSGACKDGFLSGNGSLSYAPAKVSWTGDFVAGEMQRGVMRMTDGTVYEGEFKNNHWHGRGTLRFSDGTTLSCAFTSGSSGPGPVVLERPDGSRYEGEYDHANRLIEGRGKATYANGGTYEGMWRKGVVEGEGVYKLASGDVLTGTFVNGLLTGTGSIAYASGVKYHGEVQNGAPHGQGELEYTDGAKYTGAFIAGRASGFGKTIYPNGNVYEGEHLGSAAHGRGKLTGSDGSVLEGQWQGNALNGECSYQTPYLTRRGTCINSKLQGTGHLEDSRSNLVYDGEFLDDKFQGLGVLRGKDYRYEGQFAAGQPDGQGSMIFPNVRIEGEFTQGRLLRGKLDAGGRKFEVDVAQRSFSEVLANGRKRAIARKVVERYGPLAPK